MNSTAQVLMDEVKRLRSLADRMETFARELDGPSQPMVHEVNSHRFHGGGEPVSFRGNPGEYVGMTQHAAILKALEYGPQTTRELFERLNAGGMTFKKPVYITALLGRLKDVVERTPTNKIQLKGALVNVSKP